MALSNAGLCARTFCTFLREFSSPNTREEATAASTGNLDMVLPFHVRPHDGSDAARWNRTSLGPTACAGLTVHGHPAVSREVLVVDTGPLGIVKELRALVHRAERRVDAEVTTAVPMTDGQVDRLRDALSQATNQLVERPPNCLASFIEWSVGVQTGVRSSSGLRSKLL